MDIDNALAQKIWYQGLGKAYRPTRGRLGGVGTHDPPRHRLIYYIIVGLVQIFMSANLFIFAWFMREVYPTFMYVAGIVGCATTLTGIELLRAAYLLNQAITLGKDTDINDPLRMKAMHRAIRWGMKKGVVSKDQSGLLCYTAEK